MSKRIIDQLTVGKSFTVFYRHSPRDDKFAGHITMKVNYLAEDINAIWAEIDTDLVFVDLAVFDYWNSPEVSQDIGRRYEFSFGGLHLEEQEGEGFDLESLAVSHG